MKRVLIVLLVGAVFSMALFANAYAGSTEDQNAQKQGSMGMMAPNETPGSTTPPSGGFSSYGADYRGAPVEGSWAQNCGEGQAYRPWLVPGSTTPSSGGFGSYGAEPYTEIENPEREMQTHYGQAPCSTEEGGQPDLQFLRPGSTTPPSGGFGSY